MFTRRETSRSLDEFDRANIRAETCRDSDGCGSDTIYWIEPVGSGRALDIGHFPLSLDATRDLTDQIARAIGFPPLVRRLVRRADHPEDSLQEQAGLTDERSDDAEIDTVDLKQLVAQHNSQAEWDRWVKALGPTGAGPRRPEAVSATDLRVQGFVTNL